MMETHLRDFGLVPIDTVCYVGLRIRHSVGSA